MELVEKTFDELTTRELHECLKVRVEIFVVEQRCAYQEVDDLDYESIHVFYRNGDGQVQAYLRLYRKEDEPQTVQMGRVLTRKHGIGLGAGILREGIRIAKEKMKAVNLYIEAQEYAIGYYEREGFRVCSATFLEDGIPHVQMRLSLTADKKRGEEK